MISGSTISMELGKSISCRAAVPGTAGSIWVMDGLGSSQEWRAQGLAVRRRVRGTAAQPPGLVGPGRSVWANELRQVADEVSQGRILRTRRRQGKTDIGPVHDARPRFGPRRRNAGVDQQFLEVADSPDVLTASAAELACSLNVAQARTARSFPVSGKRAVKGRFEAISTAAVNPVTNVLKHDFAPTAQDRRVER